MVGENQPYRLMVKIGCLEVTTLQFQGIKEMDMASGVVWPKLPPTKKKPFSPEFLTEGNSHSLKGGVCCCTEELSPIKKQFRAQGNLRG